MDTNNSENKAESYVTTDRTVVLCGTSRFPENATAKHVFGFFSLEIELEPAGSKILNFSCTMCPALGEKILQESLVGCEVEEGIKNAIEDISTRFFGNTKKTVIAAIRDLSAKYVEYKKSIRTVCKNQ